MRTFRMMAALTLGALLTVGCAAGSEDDQGDTNLSVMQTGTDEAQTVNGGTADEATPESDGTDRDFLPASPIANQPVPELRPADTNQ